ncbi:hypothetical protein, partial [Bombilactobacillus bombi]|uniref:hypothetical protein n=1 Tax=Bombilactobacillus bombi TaxID=1303590 RepID=UPI001C62BC03
FMKIKKVIDNYCKRVIYHESEFQEIKKQIVEYQDKVHAFVNRHEIWYGCCIFNRNRYYIEINNAILNIAY